MDDGAKFESLSAVQRGLHLAAMLCRGRPRFAALSDAALHNAAHQALRAASRQERQRCVATTVEQVVNLAGIERCTASGWQRRLLVPVVSGHAVSALGWRSLVWQFGAFSRARAVYDCPRWEPDRLVRALLHLGAMALGSTLAASAEPVLGERALERFPREYRELLRQTQRMTLPKFPHFTLPVCQQPERLLVRIALDLLRDLAEPLKVSLALRLAPEDGRFLLAASSSSDGRHRGTVGADPDWLLIADRWAQSQPHAGAAQSGGGGQ